MEDVTDIFEYQCRKKGLKFIVDIADEILLMNIFSDFERIKQILLNIVANALKFTFKGHIKIEIKEIEDQDKKYLEFCVDDTGIGIKEEDQSKLFKLFGMIKDSKSTINQKG
jgi:signal transduction histidine kinase